MIVPPGGVIPANAPDLNSGPTLTAAAQVYVKNVPTGKVNITNITVDGAGNNLSGCGTDLVGILYQNSSGTIDSVVARNQELVHALFGCQDGLGLWVQSSGADTEVKIQNSSVHDYQKDGIEADDDGTNVTVQNNSVVGVGPNDQIAQNGIQISYGAQGQVKKNFVINDVYAPQSAAGSGILVFAASNVQVQQNYVANTQEAIAFVSDPISGAADNGQANGNTIALRL